MRAALLCCVAWLAAGAGDSPERLLTVVSSRHCVPADPILNLPEGVFPPRFPYNEPVLTTYWMPPGTTAAFRLDCSHARFLVDTSALPFVNRNPFSRSRADEWNNPLAQYTVTWHLPDSAPLSPSLRAYVAARNPGRFMASTPAIRPWGDPRGNPELVMEANVNIANVEDVGAPSAQFNMAFYLLDTTSGKFFSYVVNLYANHESEIDFVGHDIEFAFVSNQMPREGTPDLERPFFRRSPRSRGSSLTPWREPRFFRIEVGREHIARAARAVNARPDVSGGGYSEDPAAYLLISAGLIQEHVYHRGESTLMDASFSDFAVYVARNSAG